MHTCFSYDGEMFKRPQPWKVPRTRSLSYGVAVRTLWIRAQAHAERWRRSKSSTFLMFSNTERYRSAILEQPRSRSCACPRVLIVPMLRDDEVIGALSCTERCPFGPLTDKQIDLVADFRRPSRHRHREHAAAQ